MFIYSHWLAAEARLSLRVEFRRDRDASRRERRGEARRERGRYALSLFTMGHGFLIFFVDSGLVTIIPHYLKSGQAHLILGPERMTNT